MIPEAFFSCPKWRNFNVFGVFFFNDYPLSFIILFDLSFTVR